MRTFIAVPIEPSREFRQILRRLDLMGRPIKPVRPEQMHITLKFLGEIATEQTTQVADAMAVACANAPAASITLAGLGVFPDRRRPAVLWAGIHNAESLIALEEAISSYLEPLGYPRERRAYHPHLTLARVTSRPPDKFFELLDEHDVDSAATNWGTFPVNQIVLYESRHTPAGFRYAVLATHVLSAPSLG